MYIVPEQVHATHDNFLFSVEDEVGNQQTSQRLFRLKTCFDFFMNVETF